MVEDIATLHPDVHVDARQPRESITIGGAARDGVVLVDRPDTDRLNDEIAQLLTLIGRADQVAEWRVER